MKTCSKCLKEKQENEFYTRRDTNKPRLHSHCLDCVRAYKKNHYESNKFSNEARWNYTKSACKKKGIHLALTEEEYVEQISKPCHYCNSDLKVETGIGLDRIDNSKHYSIDNVLPCCGRCNMGRQDLFTSVEWKIMIEALLEHQKQVVPFSRL